MNVVLPAFAAECRAAAPRYRSQVAGDWTVSKLLLHCCNGTDRQMDGHRTITQTLLGMLCGQYQQQQQIVKMLTGNKQQSVALDSLRRAGECRVTMTALVECVARLLDNAEFLVHQLLQLLTHTSTLTINRFIIINTFVYSAISLLEPPNQPFNGLFSRTTWVSQYQKWKNQSGFYWSKRQSVAVASAGPHASLHLAPDR